MDEKLLLVFNTTKDEYMYFNDKYSIQIDQGRIVAFDGEINTLFFGTDAIPCSSSKFIELTSGISFNEVMIISKTEYMKLYYDQLSNLHGIDASLEISHDYGDIGYEAGTTASKLMDLGIKFKITRNYK